MPNPGPGKPSGSCVCSVRSACPIWKISGRERMNVSRLAASAGENCGRPPVGIPSAPPGNACCCVPAGRKRYCTRTSCVTVAVGGLGGAGGVGALTTRARRRTTCSCVIAMRPSVCWIWAACERAICCACSRLRWKEARSIPIVKRTLPTSMLPPPPITTRRYSSLMPRPNSPPRMRWISRNGKSVCRTIGSPSTVSAGRSSREPRAGVGCGRHPP